MAISTLRKDGNATSEILDEDGRYSLYDAFGHQLHTISIMRASVWGQGAKWRINVSRPSDALMFQQN